MNTPFSSNDMASLCALNKDLASQALAQLYADGNIDLALEWAPRLDPFKSLVMRADSLTPPPLIPSLLFLTSSSFSSMVDLVLATQDIKTLSALGLNDGFFHTLFVDNFDRVVREATAILHTHPSFATYLFEGLTLMLHNQHRVTSHEDSPLCMLAEAAVKYGHFSWIPELNELRVARENTSLPGYRLASKYLLEPLCLEGVKALVDTQCVPSSYWLKISQAFIISDKPGHQDFALHLLELNMNQNLETLHLFRPTQSSFLCPQTFSPLALFTEPTRTPLAWLNFYLSKGLDPFAQLTSDKLNKSCTASLNLLGANWRSTAEKLHPRGSTNAANERLNFDDTASHLLKAMLASSASGSEPSIDMRFDINCFGTELQSIFSGARKIDLLCACIGHGFYRCADLLVAHGADWRFASKQCAQWLRRAHRLDSLETVSVAKAYCDALALRDLSVKSTQRRDRRLKTTTIPLAPSITRSKRL